MYAEFLSLERYKCAPRVEIEKSCKMNVCFQKSASTRPRTSPPKDYLRFSKLLVLLHKLLLRSTEYYPLITAQQADWRNVSLRRRIKKKHEDWRSKAIARCDLVLKSDLLRGGIATRGSDDLSIVHSKTTSTHLWAGGGVILN